MFPNHSIQSYLVVHNVYCALSSKNLILSASSLRIETPWEQAGVLLCWFSLMMPITYSCTWVTGPAHWYLSDDESVKSQRRGVKGS